MENMVCYEISMLCHEIAMLCYAMVYVVKDKHSATVHKKINLKIHENVNMLKSQKKKLKHNQ